MQNNQAEGKYPGKHPRKKTGENPGKHPDGLPEEKWVGKKGLGKKGRWFSAGRFAFLLLMLTLSLMTILSGCATARRNSLFQEADRAFTAGNYDAATSYLESRRDALYSDRDEVLYHLETGMLNFFAGSSRASIRHLDAAELLIDDLFTRSISQAAGSLLINDLQRDYSGEDFEDIYLNIFKALNYLSLNDTDSAFVEIRRLSNKLQLLEDKYKPLTRAYSTSDDASGLQFQVGSSRFHNSALARYLSLIMYRSEGDFDDARIDWRKMQEAFALQENLYPFPLPFSSSILDRSTDKLPLSLLAFTGRSPLKRASTLRLRTYTDRVLISAASSEDPLDGILRQYLSIPFKGVEEGCHFTFEIPRMLPQGSQVDRIRVKADGQLLGELSLLEDMEQITLDTFEIKEPMILLRSAARTVIKGVSAKAAGDALEKSGKESGSLALELLGFLGKHTVQAASDLSEQADLRVSRYFPAYAYAGEWELPPGEYHIEVEYFGSWGYLFTDDLGTVLLSPDSPNVLTSAFNR
ncbi:MAG: hypothetical protein K9K78_05545 [Spirochaetales bacterium]|nr:hypothetical protein [Spirochaetales bacterium]